METTAHGKLVAKRDGIYTVYVFETKPKEYVMCTKLPNWGVYNINIGDTGFITYQPAESGESYVDRETGETRTYKFSNIYFKDFVKDIEKNEVIL